MTFVRGVLCLVIVLASSWAVAQGTAEKGGADTRRSGYQDMGEALQKMQAEMARVEKLVPQAKPMFDKFRQ